MASGAWSGLATGAAAGAAQGSVFGGWGAAIGGAVGGLAGLFSGSSNDSQFANQMAWASYNAQSQYNIDMSNIMGQTMIANLNAKLAMQAAAYNAQAQIDTSTLNAQIITATTQYNNSLLDNELSLMWEAADLDLLQLSEARARERGGMIADQAASGTIIGLGSNADVVIDQMTQEAMDAMIVRHGANIEAANISNQQAQNSWQGHVAAQKTMWEGQLGAFITTENARLQAAGMKASAGMGAISGMQSAGFARDSAMQGITNAQNQYGRQNTQNMVSGLFNAASTAVRSGYASSVPTAGGTGSSLAVGGGAGGSYQFGTGYVHKYNF